MKKQQEKDHANTITIPLHSYPTHAIFSANKQLQCFCLHVKGDTRVERDFDDMTEQKEAAALSIPS